MLLFKAIACSCIAFIAIAGQFIDLNSTTNFSFWNFWILLAYLAISVLIEKAKQVKSALFSTTVILSIAIPLWQFHFLAAFDYPEKIFTLLANLCCLAIIFTDAMIDTTNTSELYHFVIPLTISVIYSWYVRRVEPDVNHAPNALILVTGLCCIVVRILALICPKKQEARDEDEENVNQDMMMTDMVAPWHNEPPKYADIEVPLPTYQKQKDEPLLTWKE